MAREELMRDTEGKPKPRRFKGEVRIRDLNRKGKEKYS